MYKFVVKNVNLVNLDKKFNLDILHNASSTIYQFANDRKGTQVDGLPSFNDDATNSESLAKRLSCISISVNDLSESIPCFNCLQIFNHLPFQCPVQRSYQLISKFNTEGRFCCLSCMMNYYKQHYYNDQSMLVDYLTTIELRFEHICEVCPWQFWRNSCTKQNLKPNRTNVAELIDLTQYQRKKIVFPCY